MTDVVIKRDKRGHWLPGQSGNMHGRGPRRARLIREMLDPHMAELVQRTLDIALTGDVQALRLLLERLCPPIKSEAEPQEIPGLAEAVTFAERVKVVVDAIGRGELSAENAEKVLGALAAGAQLVELEELKTRLSVLEAKDLL